MTDDEELAGRIRMIANHGQRVKYHHDVLGCNSRLDTIQAAVLDVKLRHLDEYGKAPARGGPVLLGPVTEYSGNRGPGGDALHHSRVSPVHVESVEWKTGCPEKILGRSRNTGHDLLSFAFAKTRGVQIDRPAAGTLDTAERLSCSVLSLPIHTELTPGQQDIVIERIKEFYK